MTQPLQKVLIVDDSPTNLALLDHMLTDVECEVVQAESGQEAVDLVRNNDFALILLDIQMPEMNGYETATRIKEYERGRHIPIIFITAIFQDDENVRQGYETGAVDYLFRPVEAHVLISKVQAFLEMGQYRARLEDEVERHLKTEAALKAAEEKFRSIFERAAEGIYQATLDGTLIEANPAMIRILGYDSVDEVVGKPEIQHLVVPDAEELRGYRESIKRDGSVTGYEFQLRRKDGDIIWCSVSASLVTEENGEQYIEGVLEDISERKAAEKELERLATIDSLTGIANRHRFFDRLEHALALAKRMEKMVAILFVDLNDFKLVNDTYGHRTGDELLQQVAQRLQRRVRESDTLARIGGDEFGVILTGIKEEKDAEAVIMGLLDVIQAPFEVQGQQVTVGVTIGVSFYPQDGKDSVTLISRADAAMYGVKRQGSVKFGTYAKFGVPK